MIVVDVTGALVRAAALAAAAGEVGVEELALDDGPGESWALVRVPVGARWEALATRDRAALVLDGVGTWTVDGERQSLASGHLVLAPAGVSLAVVNDGATPIAALVRTGAPVGG